MKSLVIEKKLEKLYVYLQAMLNFQLVVTLHISLNFICAY